MQKTIHDILTDQAARQVEDVQRALSQEASAGVPWWDEAA